MTESSIDLQRLRSYGFTDEHLEFLRVLWDILPSDALKTLYRIAYLFFVRKEPPMWCSLSNLARFFDKEKLAKLLQTKLAQRFLEQVKTLWWPVKLTNASNGNSGHTLSYESEADSQSQFSF
jgi:hypothetical protein